MTDVFPGLRYRDPAGAIDWLGSAFGLREHFVVRGEDGTVHHAELAWGDGFVMLGAQRDGFPANPGQLYLVVAPDELDAHHDRATAAGAQVVIKLEDLGYGRGYTATDPEGNVWSFGTYRPS